MPDATSAEANALAYAAAQFDKYCDEVAEEIDTEPVDKDGIVLLSLAQIVNGARMAAIVVMMQNVEVNPDKPQVGAKSFTPFGKDNDK